VAAARHGAVAGAGRRLLRRRALLVVDPAQHPIIQLQQNKTKRYKNGLEIVPSTATPELNLSLRKRGTIMHEYVNGNPNALLSILTRRFRSYPPIAVSAR
jgi:hypothetical protein